MELSVAKLRRAMADHNGGDPIEVVLINLDADEGDEVGKPKLLGTNRLGVLIDLDKITIVAAFTREALDGLTTDVGEDVPWRDEHGRPNAI